MQTTDRICCWKINCRKRVKDVKNQEIEMADNLGDKQNRNTDLTVKVNSDLSDLTIEDDTQDNAAESLKQENGQLKQKLQSLETQITGMTQLMNKILSNVNQQTPSNYNVAKNGNTEHEGDAVDHSDGEELYYDQPHQSTPQDSTSR